MASRKRGSRTRKRRGDPGQLNLFDAPADKAPARTKRAALLRLKAKGKFVIAHAQNEDVRMSMPGYVAAADADEFWLQGVSEFMPMGLSAEMSFLGGTFSVAGDGGDIWGTADGFHFAYAPLAGAGVVAARVSGDGRSIRFPATAVRRRTISPRQAS